MSALSAGKIRCHAALLLVVVAIPSTSSADATTPLSQECEIAVARSALPKRLRENASVYAPADGKYKQVVQGTGPFTCIIERNHPGSSAPQCMDRAGVDSLLPAIIARSQMALSGKDLETIARYDKQMVDSGAYKSPSRAGISYMMSDYNSIFVESAERILKVAPHVMYYAPNIGNDDVGGSLMSATENVGTPFVLGEGPHSLMIVYTEHEADPDEVAEVCRGQLGERPPGFSPLPKG
jgi:hypothetical protein